MPFALHLPFGSTGLKVGNRLKGFGLAAFSLFGCTLSRCPRISCVSSPNYSHSARNPLSQPWQFHFGLLLHFRLVRPAPLSMPSINQALVDKLPSLCRLATLLLHELVHLEPLVIKMFQNFQLSCFSILFFQKAPCSW